MKKQTVETIAGMVEGLLTANRSIVVTRPNRISFLPVTMGDINMQGLLDIATTLANNALARGFSDMESLKKSLSGATHLPTEAFEVERPRFKIGCFIYKNQNQCHLIIFGK